MLHDNAKVNKLCDRHNVALLCIMYELCQNRKYEKIPNQPTRAADGYIFDLAIPHMGIYNKSPYYIGASMWNLLPVDVRNLNNKYEIRERLNNYD